MRINYTIIGMKTQYRSLLVILAVLLASSGSLAQSITLAPINGTKFCEGDIISVTATITGKFASNNVFTVELSDSGGSFANYFQSIGSLAAFLPGTIVISSVVPPAYAKKNYRLRIVSSDPAIASADNGTDFTISYNPAKIQDLKMPPVLVGQKATFTGSISGKYHVDSVYWDFGADAMPASAAAPFQYPDVVGSTTYMKSGDKTITTWSRNDGCSNIQTFPYHVFDCFPAIPSNAIVVNSDLNPFGPTSGGKVYWVNAGATLTLSGDAHDTVFAEPGSIVNGGTSCVFYVKKNGLYGGGYMDCVIIYAEGATAYGGNFTYLLPCASMDFDYTNAPFNPAKSDVRATTTDLKPIELFPNPTAGSLSITNIPPNIISIVAFTILGEKALEISAVHQPDCTLDLTTLPPDTYYLRFQTTTGVVTKKIIRQ